MRNTKQKTIAIVLGYGNIMIHSLLSFILTPVMIATWSDASYGVYKIILSLMTYFMIIDSGIRNSVIRFVSEYRSNKDITSARKYVASIISFYVIASLILCGLVYAFSFFIPSLYAKSLTKEEIQIVIQALPWLILYTIGTFFYNCFTAFVRGYNKQIIVQTVDICRSLFRFGLIFFLLKTGSGVVETIAFDAIIALVFSAVVIGYVFFFLHILPQYSGINMKFIRKIFNYSLVMLLYALANSLFWSAGNFLVGVMTSSTKAAVYTTSVTITNIFQSLSSAVSQVLVPDIMVKGFKQDNTDELNKTMIRVGKLEMYIMLLILTGFGVFGKNFVILWVGKQYIGTYIIALITMIPIFFSMLQDVPLNIMLVKNKHKTMAVMTFITAAVNLVISFFLIKIWGIYGAALGTAISYTIVYIVITYYYFTSVLGFDMKSLYVQTVGNNFVYIVFVIFMGILVNKIPVSGWVGLIIKIIIFCIQYFIGVMLLSTDRKEITFLLKRKRKVSK